MTTFKDAMARHDAAVWPILQAIDVAVLAGVTDLEAISEDIERHLEWWADEMAALATQLPEGGAMNPQQSTNPAEQIITDAVVEAVEDRLLWNVTAYGKAWTEERGDTEFIVGDAAQKAIAALWAAGYVVMTAEAAGLKGPRAQVAALATTHPPTEDR